MISMVGGSKVRLRTPASRSPTVSRGARRRVAETRRSVAKVAQNLILIIDHRWRCTK